MPDNPKSLSWKLEKSMAAEKESTNSRVTKNKRIWFDRTVAHWEDQYADQGLLGRVVQKRMLLALEYLDDEKLPSGARVLDLGCGPGIITEQIASFGFRTYAVDFSDELLVRARKRLKCTGHAHTYLVQADAHRLPFKSDVFDAIVCIALISWVTNPAEALREVARILRPGGAVMITVRNRFCIENVFDPLFWVWQLVPDAARAWVRGFIGRSKGEAQKDRSPDTKQFGIRHFDKMLRTAGLEKVQWRTIRYGPFRLFRRSIFPRRVRVAIDRGFERIWWAPVIRRLGWTYCVKAIRPLGSGNTRLEP